MVQSNGQLLQAPKEFIIGATRAIAMFTRPMNTISSLKQVTVIIKDLGLIMVEIDIEMVIIHLDQIREDINIMDTATGDMVTIMILEVIINAMIMMIGIKTINEEIVIIRGLEDTGVMAIEITIDIAAIMGKMISLTSQDVNAVAQI